MTVCTIIINFELTYACFVLVVIWLSNNGFEILYREEVTHLLASTTNHKSVILFLANYSSASVFFIIKFYLFNLINRKFRFDYKCDLKIFQIILLHFSFIHPQDPTGSTSPIFEILRNRLSFSNFDEHHRKTKFSLWPRCWDFTCRFRSSWLPMDSLELVIFINCRWST